MTFSIDTATKAKLEDVRVLSQKNRQPDENPGVQLPLSVKLSNHVLTTIDGALKAFLFTKNESAEPTATRRKDNTTGTLDGVEAVSDLPKLSSLGSKVKPVKLSIEVTGGALEVVFATTKLLLDDCRAHGFSISPQEGGTVLLKFTVDAPNASETVFAKLAKYKSREVEITFVQHEAAQQNLDDDTDADAPPAQAPRKPGAPERAAVAKAKGGKPDATEAFAAAHKGDDAPIPTKSGATLSPAAAWPFPTDGKGADKAPPQDVTIETSRPGTRTARGLEKTKAALAKGALQ